MGRIVDLCVVDTQFGSDFFDWILRGAGIRAICVFDIQWAESTSEVSSALICHDRVVVIRVWLCWDLDLQSGFLLIVLNLGTWKRTSRMVRLVAFTTSEIWLWKTARFEPCSFSLLLLFNMFFWVQSSILILCNQLLCCSYFCN